MKFILKRLILIVLAIYAVYLFISQQKMLNTYAAEKKQYNTQINEAQEQKQLLTNTLNSMNSIEYIEDMARNKLDMYLPNERVYIDVTK